MRNSALMSYFARWYRLKRVFNISFAAELYVLKCICSDFCPVSSKLYDLKRKKSVYLQTTIDMQVVMEILNIE